jgi:hypothetical protein
VDHPVITAAAALTTIGIVGYSAGNVLSNAVNTAAVKANTKAINTAPEIIDFSNLPQATGGYQPITIINQIPPQVQSPLEQAVSNSPAVAAAQTGLVPVGLAPAGEIPVKKKKKKAKKKAKKKVKKKTKKKKKTRRSKKKKKTKVIKRKKK